MSLCIFVVFCDPKCMKTPNGKLFVEESIEINAKPEQIWKVLTDAELSEEWIKQWWPEVHIESNWKLGDSVHWITENGSVGSEGRVTFMDPLKVVRFTFEVKGLEVPKEEEITYVFHDKGDYTHFSVSVGDFGDTPEHEACYPGALDSWRRSLPMIKYLAENQGQD